MGNAIRDVIAVRPHSTNAELADRLPLGRGVREMYLHYGTFLDLHGLQGPEDAVLVSGGNRHVFADLLFNRSTTQATAPCWGILDQPDNERGSSAASYRVPQGGQRPAAGLSVVWYLKLQISIHLEVLAIPGNGREAIFERRGCVELPLCAHRSYR